MFEIKPLTWYKGGGEYWVAGGEYWVADTAFGRLRVAADPCEWWLENRTLRELCASTDAGKAAAETHYRTLVEKLLLPVRATPVDRGVQIRPLTWYTIIRSSYGQRWRADTVLGRLHVQQQSPDLCEWWFYGQPPQPCESPDDGKAKAEASYRWQLNLYALSPAVAEEEPPKQELTYEAEWAARAESLKQIRAMTEPFPKALQLPPSSEAEKAQRFAALARVMKAWEHPDAYSEVSCRPTTVGNETELTLRVYIPAPPLSAVTADLIS